MLFMTITNMKKAVIVTKQRRRKESPDFNCAVIDYENDLVALEHLFNGLKESQPTHFNERFQIIFYYRTHFLVADFQIKDDQLSIFILDAANRLNDVEVLVSMMTKFATCAQLENITYYYAGGIQKDGENCDVFALDQAICLSKIPNVHESLPHIISKNQEEFQACEELKNVFYISIEDFPTPFGPLLRLSQHINQLEKIFLAKHPSEDRFWQGSRKKNLPDYLAGSISDMPTNNGNKKLNLLVYRKKQNFSDRISAFENESIENQIVLGDRSIDLSTYHQAPTASCSQGQHYFFKQRTLENRPASPQNKKQANSCCIL